MYNSIEVTDNLTEVKFLEEFIENLCSDNISCSTDLSDLEDAYTAAIGGTTTDVSFQIDIGSNFSLIFSHPNSSGTFSDGLTVKLKKFGETSSTYTTLTTHLKLSSSADTTPGTAADRKLYYILAKNSNVVSLMIGSYNTTLSSSWDFDLCFLLDDGYNGWAAAYNNNSPYTSTTPAINGDFSFNGVTTEAYNRMDYEFAADRTLEYTNSKVFINTTTDKVHYTTANIVDCSTIEGAHKHITINDNEYYSLNTNTLIAV